MIVMEKYPFNSKSELILHENFETRCVKFVGDSSSVGNRKQFFLFLAALTLQEKKTKINKGMITRQKITKIAVNWKRSVEIILGEETN